jgi:LmbE family N-acetylglucosaminyl deacetylase
MIRKPTCVLLAFLFAFLLLPDLSAGASSFQSTCPASFRMEGTVNTEGILLLVTPGSTADAVRLARGDTLEVTGTDGDRYTAVLGGQAGTVRAGYINLSGIPDETVPESLSDTLVLENLLPDRIDSPKLSFSGELRAPVPVRSLTLFFWDERSLSLEKTLLLNLREPTDTVSASVLNSAVHLSQLRGGRKTLVVQGNTGSGSYVLARQFFVLRGEAQEPAHITDRCTLSVSEPLLDSALNTVWRPTGSVPSVTVSIPEGADAALLTLEWLTPPDFFTVRITGRDGRVLSEKDYETGFYADSIPLDEQAAAVRITPIGEKCALSTLRVYPSAYAGFAVQRWEPLPDKVDLMLFSAHQDDELLFFGGMIPACTAEGKTVAVTYMTDCGRDRYREALDGLWTAGLTSHPVFLGWRDVLVETESVGMRVWRQRSEDPLRDVVRVIRKYRPDVIATHDFNGEYGHIQHILTAKLVTEAAKLAGDPSYDTGDGLDSWEVKKVYVHLYESGQLVLDWDRTVEEETGMTALMLATEAYDKHRSQLHGYQMERHGVLYDNRLFGLYYSTVGEDTGENGLFENVPEYVDLYIVGET